MTPSLLRPLGVALLLAAAIGAPAAESPSPGVMATAPAEAYDTLRAVFPPPLTWVEAGELRARDDGAGRLVEPAGVACDAFGRASVSDAGAHALHRWSAEGDWLDVSGGLGSEAGQFRRPGAVARLGSFGTAVLDIENQRVVSFDLQGHLRGVLVDLAAAEADPLVGRIRPVALACDRGGASFVADADRDRVLAYDFAGQYVRAVGGYGPRPGSFQRLAGIAVTPAGELVTSERPGRAPRGSTQPPSVRLQRLDASGRPLAVWSVSVPSGRADGALPLAVDDSSRVALADERGGRVWLFARDGGVLAEMAGLARPVALAFAPDGSLFVAEAASGRVRRFRLEAGSAER